MRTGFTLLMTLSNITLHNMLRNIFNDLMVGTTLGAKRAIRSKEIFNFIILFTRNIKALQYIVILKALHHRES